MRKIPSARAVRLRRPHPVRRSLDQRCGERAHPRRARRAHSHREVPLSVFVQGAADHLRCHRRCSRRRPDDRPPARKCGNCIGQNFGRVQAHEGLGVRNLDERRAELLGQRLPSAGLKKRSRMPQTTSASPPQSPNAVVASSRSLGLAWRMKPMACLRIAGFVWKGSRNWRQRSSLRSFASRP